MGRRFSHFNNLCFTPPFASTLNAVISYYHVSVVATIRPCPFFTYIYPPSLQHNAKNSQRFAFLVTPKNDNALSLITKFIVGRQRGILFRIGSYKRRHSSRSKYVFTEMHQHAYDSSSTSIIIYPSLSNDSDRHQNVQTRASHYIPARSDDDNAS